MKDLDRAVVEIHEFLDPEQGRSASVSLTAWAYI